MLGHALPYLAVSDMLTGLGPRIVLTAAVLGALVTISTFVVKAFRKIPSLAAAIVRYDRAAHAILGDDEHPGMADRLRSVEAELHPNGGGSLRDVVNRLERGVAESNRASTEAKTAAAEVAEHLVAHNDHATAQREAIKEEVREGRGQVLVLLNALSEFAADGHQKEIAYVRALREVGIDLTDIAQQLDP